MTAPPQPDRRQQRRLDTIDEVLDTAVAVMAEQGVAGLSLGEVARRMGMRPPSLYTYFPSKNALYDALFGRAATSVLDHVRAAKARADEPADRPVADLLADVGRAMAGWCLAHQVYAQLLFWRPVPGFEPTPDAYAGAVTLVADSRAWFVELRDTGRLRPDIDIDAALRDWVVVTSGVISQQLANDPDGDVDTGAFTAALPSLAAMFADRYAAPPPTPRRRPRRDH